MALTEPGFYQCDALEYHADPATEPSLSAHAAMDLLDQCPLYVFWYHPRLGAHEKPVTRAQDRGSVAHMMLTGRGRQVSIIKEASYRKGVARIERDAARVKGQVPCLEKDYVVAEEMVRTARATLATMADGQYAFDVKYGHCELVVLNRDVAGVWTRGMIDFYGNRMPVGVQIWDYKTTAASANPAMLGASMSDWALQAAMYERIVSQLRPNLAGRLAFRFLVQENEPPHVCSVVTPSAGAMLIAHKRVAAAIHIWKRCLATDKWPAYPTRPVDVSMPAWMESVCLAREVTDEAFHELNDPYLNVHLTQPRADTPPIIPPPPVASAAAPAVIAPPVPPVPPVPPLPAVVMPMPESVDGGGASQPAHAPRRGKPKGKKWTEEQKQEARDRYRQRMAELAARERVANEPAAVVSLVPKRIDL